MGSGRQVGLNLNSSLHQKVASLNYSNPYYTEDGGAVGLVCSIERPTYLELTSPVTPRIPCLNMTFGYPISEPSD